MSYEGWSNSATFGAHLYLMQERKWHELIIDESEKSYKKYHSTKYRTPFVYPALLEETFKKSKIELDEWMEGEIDWKEIAMNIETDRGWGLVQCSACGKEHNHHESYCNGSSGIFCSAKCYDTLFEECSICGCKT